jgi:DNA adenine methylase
MEHKATKPILRWPGGKTRMLPKLLPLIPEHVCYCEPFAGGLAMLLAKPRSKVEIVNDANGDLIALYRTLQFHLPEMLRQLQFVNSSRRNLYDFNAQPGLTEIQRATRFLIKNRTSFAGRMTSFAVAKTASGGAALSRASLSELLGKAHDRLDKVVVENLPYERCLQLYDSPESFFFIDPPYLHADTGAYDGWTEEQMAALASKVRKLKGNWIVTVDDSAFNRDLFKGNRMEAVTTRNGSVNNRLKSEAKFQELIIQPK